MSQLKYWDGTAWVPAVVGAKGDPGNGVPNYGTDGQVVAKDGSVPYATKWVDITGVPSGGSVGQVLTQSSTGPAWSGAVSGAAQKLQSMLDHAIGTPAWTTTSTMTNVILGHIPTGKNNRLHSTTPAFITNPITVPYNSIKNSVIGDTVVSLDSTDPTLKGVKNQVTLRGCIPYALNYSTMPQSYGQLTNSSDTFYANANIGNSYGVEPSNYVNRTPYWVEFDYYGSGFALKLGSGYSASYPLQKLIESYVPSFTGVLDTDVPSTFSTTGTSVINFDVSTAHVGSSGSYAVVGRKVSVHVDSGTATPGFWVGTITGVDLSGSNYKTVQVTFSSFPSGAVNGTSIDGSITSFVPGVAGASMDYNTQIWVWVDGVPVTPTSIPIYLSNTRGGTNPDDLTYFTDSNGTTLTRLPVNTDSGAPLFSDYQTYYYGVSFTDTYPKNRRIRVMLSMLDYGGLVIDKTDMVSAIETPPTKTVIYGDSYTRGSTTANHIFSDMYMIHLGEALNTEYFICAIGGTGYLRSDSVPDTDPGNLVGYYNGHTRVNGVLTPINQSYVGPGRLSSVTQINPDLIYIQGSINDTGTGIAVPGSGDIIVPASLFFSTYPNTPIIVSGVQPYPGSTGVPNSGSITKNARLKTAAQNNSNVIGFIDTLVSDSSFEYYDSLGNLVVTETDIANMGWITANKITGSSADTNNPALPVFKSNTDYGDGHLTQKGNIYWGHRTYGEVINILKNYLS